MVLKEAREIWTEQNLQAEGSKAGEETMGNAEETKGMADLAGDLKWESPK